MVAVAESVEATPVVGEVVAVALLVLERLVLVPQAVTVAHPLAQAMQANR